MIKQWKSCDTYVWHKNNRGKSGDGLSDKQMKWKYFDIMSFLDITLQKGGYVKQNKMN